MGQFSTVSARQELGITPATSVRANIDTRTGAGAVGAAVGQGLLDVAGMLQEKSARRKAIEEKNRANIDSLSSLSAGQIRKERDVAIATMKINTTPERWEQETTKIVTQFNEQITALDFSPKAAAEQQILAAGDLAVLPKQAFAEGSRAISKATVDGLSEQLTVDFRAGEEGMAAKTVKFIEAMRNNGLGSAEIVTRIKAAKKAGQKLKTQDIKDGWSDRIAIDPVASEKALEAELVARKAGEGVIPEDDLPSNDIQSLINLANARQVQLEADTAAARNRAQRELENELYDGLADGTADVTDVAKSQLDAVAKRRLVNDEENFAKRTVNKTWPLIDDDVAVQGLESLLTSLESGQIDRTQLNQQTNAAAADGKLLPETRDKFRALAKKGGRDAIDAAVKTETDTIKNALLTRLTDREARFIVRSQAGTLTPAEQRQAGNNAYLLQVNRHQLLAIEKEIDRIMRQTGKDTISGIEATVISSTIWEQFRKKTLEQKINDFKEFSGQRIPRPDGFPISKWDSLDSRGKAGVVEAIDRGMPPEDILKMINP